VLEIGPGKGALTAHLLPRAERVVAVEIDHILVQYLTAKFRGDSRLQLVEGDVLKTDLAQYAPEAVAGNLPYYITSPIIEKVLGLRPAVTRAVFLVQKEVAERLTSPPGTRDYGYMSVATQLLAEAELLFTVAPGAFKPPPKVESAVVRLTPRESLPVDDAGAFLRFVSTCFRQKRKTLRNNLCGAFPREVTDALPEAGMRAEQLPVAAFVDLYRRVSEAVKSSRAFPSDPSGSSS
jgi:16S rRNA (adenine1518-N6/adenine1519-N6)-dimethyltransferase